MTHFRIIRTLQAVIAIASLVGGGTARAEVALGASLGYTHFSYPDVANVTNNVLGVPSAEEWAQPGIRVGYLAPGGRWDLNTDLGLVHRTGTIGNDETTIELLPQVQATARGRSGFSPFVNGGAGLVYQRASRSATSSVTGTRPVFGAGIGVRRFVSDGHGFVRVELRYDHLSKREKELSPSDTFVFLAANLLSVKLGFDLIVTR